MSPQNEEKIVFNLKRIAMILAVTSGLTVAVTTGFGFFWTNFLQVKVDDRINTKSGSRFERVEDRLEFLLDVVYEMNPEAYQRAMNQRVMTRQQAGR